MDKISSGKTFTITGITEYTLTDIFDHIQKRSTLRLDKKVLLEEATTVFNNSQLDPRRCSQIITRLLYLLNQGEALTKDETTKVFFAITKLFQYKVTGLRRIVYLLIKELSPSADEVIIVISSLVKDMNNKTEMHRANAIRVLCRIIEGTLVKQIERFLKQAIVDKNPSVSSAALVSGIHLLETNLKIVKRWSNEVQETIQSRAPLVKFHALALSCQILQDDRLALSRLITSLTKGIIHSPLAQCLLIRYIGKLNRESNFMKSQTGPCPFYDYLEGCLGHKEEMVKFEAARVLTNTSRELIPAITVLKSFLISSKPVLRLAALRTLDKAVLTHPTAVTNISMDLKRLSLDRNVYISSFAYATLLRTGDESIIVCLMKQVATYYPNKVDMFNLIVVDVIDAFCIRFPNEFISVMNILSRMYSNEACSLKCKETIVFSFARIIRGVPAAKENGVLHLCKFLEDCDDIWLSIQILNLLEIEGPKISDPSKYILYIYNRAMMVKVPAIVRARARRTLTKFGVTLKVGTSTGKANEDVKLFDADYYRDCIRKNSGLVTNLNIFLLKFLISCQN